MGRRNAGDGSLDQRKDGSWVAQFKGTYRYAEDKETAKAKLHVMLAGAEEVKPSNIMVGTVFEQYLETAKVNLKPRTITRYRVAIQVHHCVYCYFTVPDSFPFPHYYPRQAPASSHRHSVALHP